MAKIRKVTAATRAAILRKSAYALPNNPSDAGFGADDIRGALFRPLTDERDSALSELDRVAAETSDILALTASETDTVFGQSGNYLHGVSGFIYEEGAAGLTVTGFTGTVPVNPAGTESAPAGAAPANPAPAGAASAGMAPANPAGTESAPAKNGSPLDPARIPAAGELQVPGRVLFSGRVLPVVGVAEGALSGVGCACLFLPASLTFLGEQALPALDKRLHGFAGPDAVMTAPETRSSSPVRIVRGENRQSEIAGLYPCGEGAGYAGGIMSAAVDGILTAEAILNA